MRRANPITSFLALNNNPGPEGHGRDYLHVSFQDPYVRITENNLRDLLYATDNKQCRADMLAVFGKKDDCHDLVYTLFIENTRHAKTTLSMEAAARIPFFITDAPVHRDKVTEFNLGPKGMRSANIFQPRIMSVYFFCTQALVHVSS
jgi:hypothetical protein